VLLLLDTHVLLWWSAGDPGLGRRAEAAIADPANVVFISAATAWEIAVKRAAGRLEAPDARVLIEAGGFQGLPIDADHAVASAELPPHHRDPFDRLLVAQAQLEQLSLVTADPQLARYDVELLDASA
jgi:PIN domain nuclease of toxin-antitoxin system